MLDTETVEQSSRSGYPERSGNKLILHDEPQYEGHLYLPGHTIGDLAVINSTIPFTVDGEDYVEGLSFNVIKSNDQWLRNDTFQFYDAYISTLIAACVEYPKNSGVELFSANVSQQQRNDLGGASHRKIGQWHCDYPWHLNTGWWVYVANADTTQFALEPPKNISGTKVDDVSDSSIWRPNPGEVVILDALTTHRVPRCYRRRIPRTIFSLEPVFTLKQTPRKARRSMLNVVDIGDYSEVPVEAVFQTDEAA